MTLTDCKYYVVMIFSFFSRNFYFLFLLIGLWFFLYTFLYFLFVYYRFLYQLDFLFCNSAFEQGHLENALIIIIIYIIQ